jgi:hypothetical protein
MARLAFTLYSIANAIWSLIPLASRTVTPSGGSITSVTGSVGSVTGAVGSVTGAVGSVTGAVGSVSAQVSVSSNSDKTGYSLTAGSYSIRKSSVQRGVISATSSSTTGTTGGSLSAVTMANAPEHYLGHTSPSATGADSEFYIQLTSTSQVTATRTGTGANSPGIGWCVPEFW